MSEESISASPVIPSKLDRTIKSTHIKKRRRRLNLRKSNSHSLKTSFNETSSLEIATAKQLDINALYYNEEPDVLGKVCNQILENERLLIKADQILPTKTTCINPMYITKCFKNIGEIAATQCEEQLDMDQLTNSSIVTSNIIPIINTEFQITETQLLRACDEAEHIENQNTKSIVQEILDDFSTVGSTPSPEKKKYSVDDTPKFQFRNKTMRTYSRKTSTSNLSLNKNLSNNKNNCKLEKLNESTTSLNCNSDVYEHIYDANSVRNKTDLPNPSRNIFKMTPFKQIILSPLKPNRKYKFVLNRNTIDEDFHGFEESEVYIFSKNDLCKDTENAIIQSRQVKPPIITQVYLDNNLSDTNKMLEEVNNLDKQKTGSHDVDDVKCDLNQDGIETHPISLIEKVSPTTSSLSKDNSSLQSLLLDCHDWDDTDFDPVCSQVESLEPSKEIELFDIEDVDWNEEFTYKSQSSSQIKKTGIGKKDCDNLNPAYNKATISSKMAKKRAEALLKEFKGHTNQVLEIPKENGFKTASNKTMAISEKARLKAQQFIQDFNNSQTMSCKISDPKEPALDPLENVKKTELIIAHTENNVGPSFTTASKKPISISEAAIEIANRLVIEVDADSSTLEMSKTVIRKRKCVEMSNDPPHTNFKKISKLSSLGVKTNTSPRTPLSSIDNGSPLKSNIPIFKLASTPLSHKHFADRRPSVLLRRNALSQFKNSYRAPIYSKSVLTPSPSFNENLKFASSVSMNHPHNINGHSFIITQDVTGFQKMPIDQSSEIRINNRDEDKN